MSEERRELRSWSIEPRDRRVHAVSPMHLHEGRLLNSLLHEAHNISTSNNKINSSQANGLEKEQIEDAQLQHMIDKYQSQVLQQQQKQQQCIIGESEPPSYAHASSSKEASVEASTRENASSLKAKLLTSQKLLTALQDENSSLKQQCEFLKKKTTRLQQLESAYETIEREYETLTSQKERQDSLEKTIRAKLENQLMSYATENEMLREQVDKLTQRLQIEPQADQLNKLNLILNEMIPQNKELLACKERQKMDIEALEITLKDQRNHIQILEKALSNAQEKVWRKDKEVEELTAGAERAAALQRAVEKSVLDKQKREEEWNRERSQLEMENAQLKMQIAKESVSVGVKKSAGARSPDSEETVAKLKKSLHAKDDRIMQLEKSVIELEAKFHEEMQRNKMAIATQSDTLSGKLKRMEEEKSEKDRKIAELTEEKQRLSEKLEEERKNSESRVNLLQREIDRLRSGDERRFREDMARMEQMRLKIADRRCFTTDRVRNRLELFQSLQSHSCVSPNFRFNNNANNHGRTSSGSRVTAPTHSHSRTHSASALLSCELANDVSQLSDTPLDLSSGTGMASDNISANLNAINSKGSASISSPFLHNPSYKEMPFLAADSPQSDELYKSSLSNGYSYSSKPLRYDVPSFIANGTTSSIMQRLQPRISDPVPKEPENCINKSDFLINDNNENHKSGEEVWNV
ncbi:unnamed protein product [Anisakis simplex]|uniref:GRIP domain-containing protein n=1 Tax=Anisakis simplex TaxID=6269 RepID=A0A0M3K3S3_ANISI|nr:unnamed protein product [Anisakis simplex]